MSETRVNEIETQHADMIHDAQMDYYGKRLATCSSDRTVRIFNVTEDDQHTLVKELRGHEGPVWMVSWVHPMFGSMLASCSHDKKVIIWKETAVGWELTKEHFDHEASVNAVAWAPHAIGHPMLACASSDGDISILSYKDLRWTADRIRSAHKNGVTSVSWAPMLTVGSLGQNTEEQTFPRLVSCGCDNLVKIWTLKNDIWGAEPEATLPNHNAWVRDVAWAPSIGLSSSMIASCSQDGDVIIWTQDQEAAGAEWVAKILHTFQDTVWRVSWSITGNILAATTADNKVTLWKESLDGEWKLVKELQS